MNSLSKIIGTWFGTNIISAIPIALTLHHQIIIHSLNGKNFRIDDDPKSYLVQDFADTDHEFYERGIMLFQTESLKLFTFHLHALDEQLIFLLGHLDPNS